MAEQRRQFSPQFKAEAVQMVIETGEPIAEVARDLGIHDGTMGDWGNAWRRGGPGPLGAEDGPWGNGATGGGRPPPPHHEPLTPVMRAHVKKLEDEIRRLRM